MKLRLGIFALVLTVAFVLGGVVVTNAQNEPDSLPWLGLSTADSNTDELHLGTMRCVRIDLIFHFTPSSLRVYGQENQVRWSYQLINTIIPESALGKWTAYVHINDMGLENSSNGVPDLNNRFQGSSMQIRDWGVHVWDFEYAKVEVLDWALVDNCWTHAFPARS